jgi:hypothetical protein
LGKIKTMITTRLRGPKSPKLLIRNIDTHPERILPHPQLILSHRG